MDKQGKGCVYLSLFDNNTSCMQATVNGMEKRILEYITKDYSWEQVVYEIIAAEGLDPWNLNLSVLSDSFLKFINKVDEIDFRIPAKYIIISAVLLRMKSDFLQFLDFGQEAEDSSFIENGETESTRLALDIGDFSIPSRRLPARRVAVTDLIDSLKKIVDTKERRELRLKKRMEKIVINEITVSDRIKTLYEKINSLLGKIKDEEVKFSTLVPSWDSKNIVETFMPLMHLDHDKKVECTQQEFFDEIYVKKLENGASLFQVQSITPKNENFTKKPNNPSLSFSKPETKNQSQNGFSKKSNSPKSKINKRKVNN